MTVQEAADRLGMPKSTYASYEDKFKGPYIPVTLVKGLLQPFIAAGIPRADILALAGFDDDLDPDPADLRELKEVWRVLEIDDRPRGLKMLRSLVPEDRRKAGRGHR